MANGSKLLLARKIDKVKKLDDNITLGDKYYTQIRYFLFGSRSREPIIDFKNIPSGGIRSNVQNGKLLPLKDVVINDKKFIVPKSLNPDEKIDLNQHFLPSDLVRILTGLARLFSRGDGLNTFNKTALDEHVKDSEDLYWVRLWGQYGLFDSDKKTGAIAEIRFENPYASKVQKLLDDVVNAAIKYEQTYKQIDFSEFDLKDEAENKLIEDLIPKILEKFESYNQYIRPYINVDKKFKEASEKIISEIKALIKTNKSDFFNNLYYKNNSNYPGNNLDAFRSKNIYDKNAGFLVNTRVKDGLKGLIQTEEYAEFVQTAISDFLRSNSDKLTSEYINPLYVEKENIIPSTGETQTTEEETEGKELEPEIKFDGPVNEQDLLSKLLDDVHKLVVENFKISFSPQYSPKFVQLNNQLPSNYLENTANELKKIIDENIISEFELDDSDKKTLTEANLYQDEKFNPDVLKSDWYKKLLEQSFRYIVEFPSPDRQFSNLFTYLFETFISPQLASIQPIIESDSFPEPEKISTAVVPPVMPVAPQAEVPELTVKTDEINRLTPEQIRSLQYESAWLYNRAIYELYTSKGTKFEDIPSADLKKLQAEIFNFASSMDIKDFNKLFGSAAYRTQALLDFYQETGRDIKEIQSSQELLGTALKESLDLDSPVLTENIKNSIDGLIMQYGLNQDFYAFDSSTQTVTEFSGVNEHDLIWFLENIPPDRLILIFNIPPNVVANEELLAKFIEVLKNYAKVRATELSLHIQNITLQKGMSIISAQDAAKIKEGDEETIEKHMSLTSDLRNMSKAHGGEVVAGAIDNKPKNHRKEIQKQFRTFLPLWENLTGWEQAQIYLNFKLNLPPQFLTAAGHLDREKLEVNQLDFIPEFIFFDITKLKEIRAIADILTKAENETKKAELVEILDIQNQLVREKKLADLLNAEYEKYSDISEIQEITEYSGVEFKEQSFVEKFQADQAIQDTGSTVYEVASAEYEPEYEETEYAPENIQYSVRQTRPRRTSFLSRISNSKTGKRIRKRFGIGFKKKFSPFEKVKKAASKAASQVLQKASSLALNVVIPGSGKALDTLLRVIPSQKVKNALSAAILGLITAVVVRTIWALGSIGGLIGGVIGGVIGYVASGGAMIVPGVIIGANIGELIIPTRWWGSWNKPEAQTAAHAAASSEAATAAKAAGTTAIVSTSAVVGATAIGGYAIIIFVTMFIILVIHSAFLIPVPSERMTVAFKPGDPGDPSSFIDCGEPSPLTGVARSSSALAGRAFDIVNVLRPGFWCYWNWHPDHDGLDATFTSLSPENPDLFDEVQFAQHPNHCVYNNTTPPGCTGDYRALRGDSLYWCTWLVNQTYQANYNLLARCMSAQFGNLNAVTENCQPLANHEFMPVEEVLCASPATCDVQPGDVIFLATVNSGGSVGHVAVVHDIQADFIRSVDSNASTRTHSYTIGTDGKVQANAMPWLRVVGFGRRL